MYTFVSSIVSELSKDGNGSTAVIVLDAKGQKKKCVFDYEIHDIDLIMKKIEKGQIVPTGYKDIDDMALARRALIQ